MGLITRLLLCGYVESRVPAASIYWSVWFMFAGHVSLA